MTVAGAATPVSPYPGPREFRPGEDALFHGRRRERADLVDLALAYRAVVLYAQSGAGKTSLVNAALVPDLRAQGMEVLPPARVSGELPPGVAAGSVGNLFLFNLRARWLPAGARVGEADVARLSGADLASSLPRDPAGEGLGPRRPALLVVDQLEELFRACPERWREREGFCRALGESLRADPSLRLLLVIREDYLAELDPCADYFPDALRIRYRLERLRDDQALEAIVEPARLRGVEFEPGVAEGLVRDLRRVQVRTRVGSQVQTSQVEGEFIEPVQLQVVCEDLWARKGDAARISSATVQAGDVDGALTQFYERAVTSAARRGPAREDEIRRWVAEKLITPAGTRGTVYKGDRETAGLPNGVVDALEAERIVRAEPRAGATWYELTHDRFLGPIRASNRRRRERRRRRLVNVLAAAGCLAVAAWVAGAILVSSRGRAVDQSTTADADTLRALASQLAQQGDRASLEKAITGYTKAIEAYARTGQVTAQARALLDRASSLHRAGRHLQAIDDFRQASRLYVPETGDPSKMQADAGTFARVGRDLYQSGSVPDAAAALSQASELAGMSGPQGAGDRAAIDADLSLALARRNDYAAAREAFDRASRAAGASADLRRELVDRLEAVIVKAPLTTQAYDDLARVRSSGGEHLLAVQVINRGIEVARAHHDPILATLRATRRDVLEAALPAIERIPELRDYVCAHNAYVVASSAGRAEAEAEVRRFRDLFPLARADAPVGDQVPIVVDSFLTCEEASEALGIVQARYKTWPFVGRSYKGCPECPGLPARIEKQ